MKCWLFVWMICCWATIAQAQLDGTRQWSVGWVGSRNASVPNTVSQYRQTIKLARKPTRAQAFIATDSKYWLYINGRMVVFEGQLKRGPTPGDTYYDEVDLSPWLQAGDNTIAVMVWYWGKDGFCHKNSGKTGLLFSLMADGKEQMVQTNWKLRTDPAFGNSLPPHPNFRLPEHNIRFDARVADTGWFYPSFPDARWNRAVVLGKAGMAPWNLLYKRPIPLWKDGGLTAYENAPKPSATGAYVMQLPVNSTITPYFKIKAAAGQLIDIRTDNYFGGSEPNVRTEYITREGLQWFESPAVFNGHQVIYTFPKDAEVLELKYRDTRYNTNYVGSFYSSDSFYNRLWQKAAYTMNVNMRDAIQDPDRERAQWWGDVVIILEEIFYACDQNAWASIRKSISNLLEWQKPDGVLFSPVPAGNWNKELPAQMLASVGSYGIGRYIQYSGDTAVTRYAYPFIKKYLGLYRQGEDGLVLHRKGGWDWHDWGDKIDVPLLDNAWYYLALEQAAAMAASLGYTQEAGAYYTQMQKLKLAFQQQFWKGNRFASNRYPHPADDRGNGLAICAGLATAEQWQAIKPMLDTTFHAGPYLEKYILEAYLRMGDAPAGLARMKKRYAAMVNHPTITTLWEGWEIGSATYGGGTYNHGWTGGPLSLLSAYVGGLRPLSTAFDRYTMAPQPAGLDTVSVAMLTPKGRLALGWRQKDELRTFYLQTIAAQAEIIIPRTSPSTQFLWQGPAATKAMTLTRATPTHWHFTCTTQGQFTLTETHR